MKTICENVSRKIAIDTANSCLSNHTAAERVEWAFRNLPEQHVLSSSFGAQAAVSLHLVTQVVPDVPVVLIDTGYLFAETYRFIDALVDRMNLNLQVFRAERSPAWQEARFGQRWEQGIEGIDAYNRENKVKPMERALTELNAGTWFAGLRRQQSKSRENVPVLSASGERWKMHPIIDWTDRDVHRYMTKNNLPYHPLWEKGYVSIGDRHTTRSLADAGSEELTRFFGLTRECGLHEENFG